MIYINLYYRGEWTSPRRKDGRVFIVHLSQKKLKAIS
jgi:hypothetical protein